MGGADAKAGARAVSQIIRIFGLEDHAERHHLHSRK
jgi:hypothetical protein